ncbi:MAG: hypothetical protein ACKOW9_00965 [Candidatus Paceibacterota bacterium]
MTEFLDTYRELFLILHVFFVVLGMGAALVVDLLFNYYIHDRKLSEDENKTLNFLTKVIWISLSLITASGLFIFLTDSERYLASSKFLLKMCIVLVIAINGFLFYKITHKSLRDIEFTDRDGSHPLVRMRRLSFAFGAISFISWLSVFLLGSLRSIPISLSQGLLIYFGLLCFGILGSQLVEHYLTRPQASRF